jgi:serine protease AprX
MKRKSVSQSVRRSFNEGGFFKLRVLLGVLLCFAGIVFVLFALRPAAAGQPRLASGQARPLLGGAAAANKIAPWVMEHTVNGQEAEFFVVLADQADLSLAVSLPTKAEKGRFVYQTLLTKAQATQDSILQWLRDRSIEHRSFYIVNAILVRGTRQVAEALAARTDVARVEGNPLIHNNLPQPGAIEGPAQPKRPAAIEPGISYTHAPQVWALGYTGQNIVVASADTGQRWTHNALKPHYRGWDGMVANHNYNWHDSIHNSVGNPCGNDSPFPCDDYFHGTHTTGTAIGDDGMGNQIGMAPGAKWIGCRNMDQGDGTPARYMECMEWFLAPYPLNCTPNEGDPTKAPDITINSWGCPPSEGCSANTLQAAVEAQAAAGIQMVVAAGNSGSSCSTVTEPPSLYAASYTIGALNTGSDSIASFSSRGPVTIDGSGRIKPDITAPGTGTRSATNSCDSCYTTASGTSMATPHISGAMALLWSAIPSLKNQITASRDALNNSAVFISSTQCGTAGPPNNVYGWGRVDIAAAVGTPSPTPSPSPTPTATATPSACGATPSPTPTTSPTATATATATATTTATATPTATATATTTATGTPTATATATATATSTPRPTPTPRSVPSPRGRPTPAPRP